MAAGEAGQTGKGGTRVPVRPPAQAAHMEPLWDVGGPAYFSYRMAVATKLFDRRVAEILENNGGLTLPQWRVLAQLGIKCHGTVRSLADGAAADRSEASRALRDLEAMGFVSREENPQDSRSPIFRLTEQGKERWTETRKPVAGFIEALVEGVDPHDLAAADRVLWTVARGCLG